MNRIGLALRRNAQRLWFALGAVGLLGYVAYCLMKEEGPPRVELCLAVLLILAASFAEWLTRLFTRPLDQDGLRRIIALAYRLSVLVLLMSVVPFAVSDRDGAFDRIGSELIGLVEGCADQIEEVPPPSRQLACRDDADPQWVVHIGGHVQERGARVVDASSASRASPTTRSGAEPASRPASADTPASAVAREEERSSHGYKIHGGLVVPFYFVALALFGGAVNLARRVPEYQRRASANYRAQYIAESKTASLPAPLSLEMAREYLVFQIMQFLSTPVIAIVAWELIGPDDVGTAGLIGFGAGFSTEVVLLRVREAVEKLSGGAAGKSVASPPPPTMSLDGPTLDDDDTDPA